MMLNATSQVTGAMNPRYKTSLCKNYNSDHGCQYGEKCQFAHGTEELRVAPKMQAMMGMGKPMQKVQKNILNYKIVKCKNFEKEGKCKYGEHCSFAHGDAELRVKSSYNPAMNAPFDMYGNMTMPMNIMPYQMDYQNPMMQPNPMMMMGNEGMYMMPQQQSGMKDGENIDKMQNLQNLQNIPGMTNNLPNMTNPMPNMTNTLPNAMPSNLSPTDMQNILGIPGTAMNNIPGFDMNNLPIPEVIQNNPIDQIQGGLDQAGQVEQK